MAYDQNAMPNVSTPINVAKTPADEPRIEPPATLVSSNPLSREAGSVGPGFVSVYYPSKAPASDAGYGGSNYAPAMANWLPRVPPPGAAPGYGGNTNYATRVVDPGLALRVGACDHVSDEGGEGLVSGRKVKFICSFGGKILPRPSDGVLRYVGGDTRIVGVGRHVGFDELVLKMFDLYGQNVVIKYQLPDEDLDALVTVSRQDDLENMMDEYDKLVERTSDGSAKLRVFLFSENESPKIVQLGDLQDSGQKYVEAVNGIGDGLGIGVGGGGGLTRKNSLLSATSTQNSEFSGTVAGVDGIGHDQGQGTGPSYTDVYSPAGNSATSIPVGKSVPGSALSAQSGHELEESLPIHEQPVHVPQPQQLSYESQVNSPSPAHYVQAYVDPHHGTFNRTEYVQVPAQMRFPAQIMGNVGLVYNQPQFHGNAAGVSPHQFIPAGHMSMTPSSHISFNPNSVPQLVQQQEIRMEHYPEERTSMPRVVQLSGDQSYNAYPPQAQVPHPVIGGPYGWNRTPHPDQVAISDCRLPHQQLIYPEAVSRFNGCVMCQKAIPHTHYDILAHEHKEMPTTTVADMHTAYQSLRSEDIRRIIQSNRVSFASGTLGDGNSEIPGVAVQSRFAGHNNHEAGKPQFEGVVNDTAIGQRAENPGHAMTLGSSAVVGFAGGLQSPNGALLNPTPNTGRENVVQQSAMPMQYQVKQEAMINNCDSNGGPSQTSDHEVHESVKDYHGKFPVTVPKEENAESFVTYENMREIDVRMENLKIHPNEGVNNEQCNIPVENPHEDILENRAPHIASGKLNLGSPGKTQMSTEANYINQNEMMACSAEIRQLHGFHPMESYRMSQPPVFTSPKYPHSSVAINSLVANEASCGNPAFSGIDPSHVTEGNPSVSEWKDYPSQFEPKKVPSFVEHVLMDSLSPFNGVGVTQENSNSLFSNQDPWMLRHDSHFPPPRSNKILTKKQVLGEKDAFGDNLLGPDGESSGNVAGITTDMQMDDGGHQPTVNSDLNFSQEHGHSAKGSAEELIKQELQAFAEGLTNSTPSNSELNRHGKSECSVEANQNGKPRYNADMQARDKDVKMKLPEKPNLGFPASDDLGRLQIIMNSDLEELRELGSGTFGTVYHGKWRGSDVAIKRINERCFAGKASEQDRMREDFWNEAIKLADLHHPNVVAFYGVVLDGPGGSVATVTEYMVNGSLRTALQKNERNLDKRKRLLIAMDVAFGMEYLHGKNIVHFDLKSDNLLVNLRDPQRPICKVGDLGLSKVKCQTLISGGVRGTLPWMAPELLNGSSSLVSEKVDVFSFGIVMWELLTGQEPYADLHYGAIIGGIVSNTLRPPVPESCDPEWKSLMERCWAAEPPERPSFTEIANELRTITAKVPPKVPPHQ